LLKVNGVLLEHASHEGKVQVELFLHLQWVYVCILLHNVKFLIFFIIFIFFPNIDPLLHFGLSLDVVIFDLVLYPDLLAEQFG